MIRALIRKDMQLLITLAVAGTITLLITYEQTRFIEVWIKPVSRGEMIFIAWWICGGALGLIVSTHEEINRTREYLTHRPLTPAQVLTSKLIGCVIVLATWLVSTTVLSITIEAVFGWRAHLTDLSNLGTIMLLATSAVSLCAAGIYAGTLPVHWVLRIIIAGCAGLVVLLLGQTLTTIAESRLNDPTLWLLFHGVMTAGLIWASYANVHQSFDPDINVPNRGRIITLSAAVVITALAGSWGLAATQSEFRGQLRRQLPKIVQKESGEYCLAKFHRRGYGKSYWEEVDTDHKPIGKLSGEFDVIDRNWFMHSHNGFGVNEPRFNLSLNSWSSRSGASLVQPEGRVYRITGDFRYGSESAKRTVLGKGPEQIAFSQHARIIDSLLKPESDEEAATIIIFDSSDGSLWKFSSKPGSPDYFVPMSLPGDHQVVGFVSVRRPDDGNSAESALFASRGQVVCSSTQSFALDDGAFRVAPDWARAEAKRLRTQENRLLTRTERLDIVTPTVRVVDSSSPEVTVFRHVYAIHTAGDLYAVGMTLLPSALRAPVLQIPSFLQPAQESTLSFGRAPYRDPSLAGGRRTWLLLLNLLLSALIAAFTWQQLTRRGAHSSTRWFWMIAILVAGPTAYFIAAWTEFRRAYRRPDMVTPEQAKPLLIHSS